MEHLAIIYNNIDFKSNQLIYVDEEKNKLKQRMIGRTSVLDINQNIYEIIPIGTHLSLIALEPFKINLKSQIEFPRGTEVSFAVSTDNKSNIILTETDSTSSVYESIDYGCLANHKLVVKENTYDLKQKMISQITKNEVLHINDVQEYNNSLKICQTCSYNPSENSICTVCKNFNYWKK